MLQRKGHLRFPVYDTREVTEGFWRPKQRTVQENKGFVTLSELVSKLRYSTMHLYLDGRQVYRNETIRIPQGIVDDEAYQLFDILEEIFEPLVAAERIQQGISPMQKLAKNFFRNGPELLDIGKSPSRYIVYHPGSNVVDYQSGPPYRFFCYYNDVVRDTEDARTEIKFRRIRPWGLDTHSVTIPNPSNTQAVKEFLKDGFELIRSLSSGYNYNPYGCR